jgi:large subunit ribosomal protein L35
MRKMKTHSGAKKRFKVTGTGKIKHRQKNKRHILAKKAPKRKMRLRGCKIAADADVPAIKRMLKLK